MAKVRKTVTRKSTIADAVSEAYGEWQSLRDEMSEWRDNLEEKFSSTSKYEQVSEAADNLDQVADNEPTIGDSLKAIEVEWVELLPRSKRKPLSRADRCSNACMIIDAVMEKLDELIEKENSDAEDLRSELDDHKATAESTDFPGMFG